MIVQRVFIEGNRVSRKSFLYGKSSIILPAKTDLKIVDYLERFVFQDKLLSVIPTNFMAQIPHRPKLFCISASLGTPTRAGRLIDGNE